MPLAALVAVSGATVSYDKLYTYEIPPALQGGVFAGSVVLVPFGRGRTKPRVGVVVQLEALTAADATIKPLLAAAPEDARLTQELLGVVRYLHEATFCTWFEAVKAVIPYGAQYLPVQTDAGWQLQKRLRRHTEAVYTLTLGEGRGRVTPKQQLVLETLAVGELSAEEIFDACGVSKAVLDTLAKNGYVAKHARDKTLDDPVLEESLPPVTLSASQQQVVEGLAACMEQKAPKPALLHGVTGSGKTLIFIELIRTALAKGKTALVLVPEIGLTPQMLQLLRQNFGSEVAVQHSALSHTERLLQWRQIQRGEARVVVGTRSAVFASLKNIGLLVVDEEQEHTYQSESAPRYNAIEVARRRAQYHGALLVLSSATPSVVSYHAAQVGRYRLFTLPERYGGLPLPAVEMVDMREELLAGGTGAVSRRLADEIDETLLAGKQAILLLNRRGYQTVGMCRSCRAVLKCSDCSVPMVYHKAGSRLLCHYCGRSTQPPPDTCPECGGEIRYTGFGTQRAEEELARLFPQAKIARMDQDTTSRKGAHAKLLAAFGRGEYDILLGTQMVAKGLDFENVSLVGIIGIDSLLFSQGYRAYETVFSLVTQVVGRSGRAHTPGRALVQTMDPENPVLALAAQQDYPAFYEQEIAFRKLGLYPPFCSLCVVGFVAEEEAGAYAAAQLFSRLLQQNARLQPEIPLRILGPAPMNVVQVAGYYRYRLTLKCREDQPFRDLVRRTLAAYYAEAPAKKAHIYLDFNSSAGE